MDISSLLNTVQPAFCVKHVMPICKSITQVSMSVAVLYYIMDDRPLSIIEKTFSVIELDLTGGIERHVLIFLIAQGLHDLYQGCKRVCVVQGIVNHNTLGSRW